MAKSWSRLALISAAAVTLGGALGVTRAAPPDTGLGSALESAARFNLSQSEANRLSIFHDYGLSVLGTNASGTPGAAIGAPTRVSFAGLSGSAPPSDDPNGLLTPFLGDYADADTETGSANNAPISPFFVSATPLVGYDSNPQGLHYARSSPFLGADVSGGYAAEATLFNGNPVRFAAVYDVTGAFDRGEVKNADGIQQSASFAVQHTLFHDTIRLNGIFRDQFTYQDGRAFLNTVDAAPSAELFWFPQISTELGYDYTNFQYFFPIARQEQDPDASRHTLSIDIHLYPLPQPAGSPVPESPDVVTDLLRAGLHSATFGYDHIWNDPDGTDFRYDGNRVKFGLDAVRPLTTKALTFDFDYAHEWQDYHDPNTEVRALLVGRNLKLLRHDHLDVYSVRANADLAELAQDAGNLSAFLQWDVIADRSTIFNRDFNEYVVSAGINYRY